MNKIRNVLSSVLFVVVYIYLKHSGLWARYRWTGVAFGAAFGVLYILKKERTQALPFAIFCCLAGVIVLLIFLIQHGDSGDGFLSFMFLGLGAPELYAHYKGEKAED